MTLESIAAVSVLASGFRTKVSIYQCRKRIKLKWRRSNNEHFTQHAERVHYIILLSNSPLRSFKQKAIKGHLAHVVRLLLYPASSHQIHALGIPSSSELFSKGCSYISWLFLKEILQRYIGIHS